MRLDFKSLAFGYNLTSGGGTPAWETALGQGREYKINESDTINSLVKGLIYKAVPSKSISFKKGKGGAIVRGDDENSSLVIAAVFDKVYINENLIPNGKFILLVAKDDSEHHKGRLKLKYGLDNAYTADDGTVTKNRDFKALVTEQFSLADDACWFVYDISVEDQDVLRLHAIIVNKEGSITYADTPALHAAWDPMIENDASSQNAHESTTSSHVDTTPLVLALEDTISEVDFRHWLSKRLKKDGNLLSVEYQNAYYYILKAIPSMLGEQDVFTIISYDEFKEYRNKISTTDAYAEANPNIGASTLSGALTQYGNYLAERNGIHIPTDRLAQILKEWCTSKCVESNVTSTLVGFGFKYARAINMAGVSAKALLDAAGIESTMGAYIDRGKDLFAAIESASIGISFTSGTNKCPTISSFDYGITAGDAVNKIFFGVPGCGKSHHIQHEILSKEGYKKANIIRTTFYQDYSNTDFVGQILPKIVKGQNGEKDSVEYIFNPGPFTLALIQAISNPTEKVALVIEEINRGNAPAIFGDIFQLLDRDHDSISEYGIVNVSMIDFLNNYIFNVGGVDQRYTFEEIKIPGNLFIYATMNTSDQNVYTLDTAFIRRWEKEKIPNVFTKCGFRSVKVPGMNCSWEKFVVAINNCITSNLEELQVNEDKQLGAFFVKESLLTQGDAEKFAYKVFDYLWSDVAKLNPGVFFNHYNTLDQLIKAYAQNGVAVFKPGIFAEENVIPQQNEADDEQ